MGLSSSTVQRAEAGTSVPKKYVVDQYIARLGLDFDRAQSLWEAARHPGGRPRRVLTPAPALALVKDVSDFGAALMRLWEECDRVSPEEMQRRAEIAHQRDKTRFKFLSRSAAYRLSRRRQPPSSVQQLRSYLHACGVPERRFGAWIEVYQRVKAKEREEARAKKKEREEARREWAWEGRSRAEAVMSAAGLDPTEPPPRSSAAPWSARCRRCGKVSRVRLTSVAQGRGCQICVQKSPLLISSRPVYPRDRQSDFSTCF
ncbi:hypothetical protein GCM10010327_69160 [Streptomyces nitrosporeus]|nr:hypothetical protein GCM10010327_69160 [Streptomyces nitrosporeus]